MKQKLDELTKQMCEQGVFLEDAVAAVEKRFICHALDEADGNQCEAAKALGIHRNTLHRKIAAYGLNGKKSE